MALGCTTERTFCLEPKPHGVQSAYWAIMTIHIMTHPYIHIYIYICRAFPYPYIYRTLPGMGLKRNRLKETTLLFLFFWGGEQDKPPMLAIFFRWRPPIGWFLTGNQKESHPPSPSLGGSLILRRTHSSAKAPFDPPKGWV